MLEDFFIFRNFINNKTNGIFLEVGALDGIKYSNTLFFENILNFTGIMIEPTIDQYNQLVKNRPKCFNVNSCVSDKKQEIIMFKNNLLPCVNSVIKTTSSRNKDVYHSTENTTTFKTSHNV